MLKIITVHRISGIYFFNYKYNHYKKFRESVTTECDNHIIQGMRVFYSNWILV